MRTVSMRVLFVIDYYIGTGGGTEGQLLELIRGVSQRGWSAQLVVFRPTAFTREMREFPCPVHTWNIVRISSLFTLWRLICLAFFIRRERISITHVFFNDAALIVPFFARIAGSRVVASRRDMGIWYTSSKLRLLRLVNRFVDCVIGNSRAVADHVARSEKCPAKKLRVIYNGYSSERGARPALAGFRERLGIGAADRIIGMVAYISPVKRHDDSLRAFAQVHRAVPRAHFVLVGSGVGKERLAALARDLGIDRSVHFLGNVVDVIPIVRHFDVGVLCSESEGFSNALIEYMACGVPPVCTAVGGNLEMIHDQVDGLLFPVGDIAALASRISLLLEDRTLALRLAENARNTAAAYTIERMVSSHLTTYSDLLAGG